MLCVSGTSDDRRKAPAWFVHTHGILCISILGDVLWNKDMIQWHFINKCVWKMCFENAKNCFNFYGVTSWYQSLGLRDSGAPSGVSELKLSIWGNFNNKIVFKRRTYETNRAESCVRTASARTVISQNTITISVMKYVMLWYMMSYVMHARVD